MDVVMMSPDARPPVVRLVEVSKYKFELDKAKKESAKKSRAAQCAPSRLPFPRPPAINPIGATDLTPHTDSI